MSALDREVNSSDGFSESWDFAAAMEVIWYEPITCFPLWWISLLSVLRKYPNAVHEGRDG